MRERVPFDHLVRASGLSSIFAAPTLRRVCEKAGVSFDQITRADVPRLIAHLENALRLYMPPEEVAKRIRDVGALGD
jgi:hypothetical protein